MAFSKDYIKQIRERSPLSEIAAESVTLKHKTKRAIALCPFHDDNSPSLSIENGRYHCWACGEEGDVLSWVMKLNHLTFSQAIKLLAHRSGIPLPADNEFDSAVFKHQRVLRQLLNKAQSIYLQGLVRSRSAITYLNERGVTAKTSQNWGLGMVSTGITAYLKGQQTDLIDVGLLGQSEGRVFECLRQRITIPIHDINGQLIGFAGRRLDDITPLGPKYINPPTTAFFDKKKVVFGLDKSLPAIRKTNQVVIVEGYFDVITLHQAGECRAVAGMGTALTEQQLQMLFRVCDTQIFCFDGDKAGQRAIRRLLPRIMAQLEDGKTCRFVFLPSGDPDEFIRTHGKEEWDQLLVTAEPLSHLLLRYITKNKTAIDVEDQVKSALRAKKICLAIKQAPYYRQILRHEVEQRYGINMELNDE